MGEFCDASPEGRWHNLRVATWEKIKAHLATDPGSNIFDDYEARICLSRKWPICGAGVHNRIVEELGRLAGSKNRWRKVCDG